MQSKLVLPGFIAAISVFAFGLASQLSAQQSDSAANLADGSEDARELAAEGAWKPNVTYDQDDIVTARGSTFRSRHDNNKGNIPGSTQPNTGDDWELLARGFNPRGPWRAARKYHANDLVTHLGTTWRARRTSLGATPAPGASWQQFAVKGRDGTQGPQGPQGIQGQQGIQGPPGPSAIGDGTQAAPSFSFTDDPDTGIFSPEAGKVALVSDGSLFLHNKGTLNTALGINALGVNTSGCCNTAVGFNALSSNTTGISNTALGRGVLAVNTDGFFNTAVGAFALENNTSGNRNIVVGSNALRSNTTGASNVAVGAEAMFANTNGSANTAVGPNALTANTTGHSNTAVGTNAAKASTTSTENTAVGRDALSANTTGGSNIAVGRSAGLNPTAPSNSIFIGNQGLAGDTTTIKIGTQGTQTTTFIAGIRNVTTGVDATVVMIDSNGQLGTTLSSRRYKEDIQPMAGASAALRKLRPVTFRYTKPYEDGSKPVQYGLIAEEVAEVFPDLAVFDKDGSPETVKYHLLPSFLLVGYQQQQKVIEQQAERIDTLEQRLRDLEARMSRFASR